MLSSSSSLVCGLLMAMWWSMNECVLSATLSPKLMFFLVAMTRKTSHESQLHKHRAPAPKKRKEKKLGFLRGGRQPRNPPIRENLQHERLSENQTGARLWFRLPGAGQGSLRHLTGRRKPCRFDIFDFSEHNKIFEKETQELWCEAMYGTR